MGRTGDMIYRDDNENTTLPRTKEALEHLEVAVGANEDIYVTDDSPDSSQSEEEDSGIMNEVVQVDKDENVNHRSSSDPSEENDSGVLDEAAGAQKDINIHNKSTCSSQSEEEEDDSGLLDEAAGVGSVQEDGKELHRELDRLYSNKLVYYSEKFKCPICFKRYDEFKGIILKECLHVFCRECLLNTIKLSETIDVNCPFQDESYSCPSFILENEIKSLLSPDAYEDRLLVTLAFAETCMDNAFHCMVPDCNGWCIIEEDMTVFLCPACSVTTCIVCRAIHEGITCDEFQDLPKELADNFSSQALGTSTSAETNQERGNQLFRELENLYSDALVYYPDEFECPICLEHYEELNGIILKECLHVFCRDCLLNTIELSESIDVNCPFRDDSYSCSSIILEDEIKSLLSPESYENRLTKTLAFAEATMQNTFHCKTPDCKGWCVIGDAITVFLCPVCSIANCIKCKVIHEGITCAEYNDILMNKSEINLSSKLSEAALRDMVQCGVAMRCPNCQAVITKQTGCDAILCSMCKTPICWATKGPRWGPRGVGDTSGGCRCNVNGIKCHPQCSNCH